MVSRLAIVLLFVAGCGDPVRLGADFPIQSDFELRRTISGLTSILAFAGDLDGDGLIDVLSQDGSQLHVDEEQGEGELRTLRRVYSLASRNQVRGLATGDADGDGRPEIFHCDREGRCQIHEAFANDQYRQTAAPVTTSFADETRVADSDGDGQGEFLVAMERTPAGIFIIEAQGDDSYADPRGLGAGRGGNARVAGAGDLDGDGLPEIAFAADDGARSWHMIFWEDGAQVYADNQHQAFPIHVGDLDGDGRDELVALEGAAALETSFRSLVLETDDFAEGFQIVARGWSEGYADDPIDFDADGRPELYRATPGVEGALNVVELAHFEASGLRTIASTGLVLQDRPDAVDRLFPLGDLDGNGAWEMAVVQGDVLRILERRVEP